MSARIAVIVFACALSASAATIDEVFPLLHRRDPSAPFAFHQWPMQRVHFDNFGVTLMVWPDRATLIIDEMQPLTVQLRALPHGLSPARAARRLRVMRWDFTAQQCSAIPTLYASLVALPAAPKEVDHSGEPIPIHGWMPNRQELFVRRGDATEHFETMVGWWEHPLAFQNVWRELDSCSKSVKGRRVRAR